MMAEMKCQILLYLVEQLICLVLVALDQLIGDPLQLNVDTLVTQVVDLMGATMEHQVVKMIYAVDMKDFCQLFLELELHCEGVAQVD